MVELTHVDGWRNPGEKQRKIEELEQINKELTKEVFNMHNMKAELAEVNDKLSNSQAAFRQKEKDILELNAEIESLKDTIEEVHEITQPNNLSNLDDPEAEWYFPTTPTPAVKKAPFTARAKTGMKHSRRTHDKRI